MTDSASADLIGVTLNDDGSVTVSDNGRGIPIDVDQHELLSATELIMTKISASIPYSVTAHKHSDRLHIARLHDADLAVVNALSEMLELRIWRDKATDFDFVTIEHHAWADGS